MNKNLLEETKQAITKSGHKIQDIVYIGSSETNHSCTWRQFKKLADVEYYSGYGASQVAPDLIIQFRDGSTMWRGEYDGAEWWEYSAPFVPPEPKDRLPIYSLVEDLWHRLAEIKANTKEVL